jgi:hypothetical protein
VSALYVDPRGPYPKLVADWWDEKRDARLYAGPNPVVAHPPCGWWGKLAPVNSARYGKPIGSDDGCFAAALACVRKWGGVLEHPAGSLAWSKFDLSRPVAGGWIADLYNGGWVCEISQRAYGHPARKLTWIYCRGVDPRPFDRRRPEPVAQCSNLNNRGASDLPRLTSRQASATPPAFAEWLISLAAQAKRVARSA